VRENYWEGKYSMPKGTGRYEGVREKGTRVAYAFGMQWYANLVS